MLNDHASELTINESYATTIDSSCINTFSIDSTAEGAACLSMSSFEASETARTALSCDNFYLCSYQ